MSWRHQKLRELAWQKYVRMLRRARAAPEVYNEAVYNVIVLILKLSRRR